MLWLEIPKIELKREVYSMDSPFNHVDYHVEILKESNQEHQVLFLASHSGRGDNSYFNDLIYLEKGDSIWIFFEGKRYNFFVDDVYLVSKTGYLALEEENLVDVLYLITCSLVYTDKQLVVRANLVC